MGSNVATVDLKEFPFVEALPRRERSKLGKLLDVFERIEQVTAERGPVVPQTVAAEFLGISRQGVCQYVDQGRIESVAIGESRFVLLRSLIEFAKIPRVKGRPLKKGNVASQGFKTGVALAEAAWGKM